MSETLSAKGKGVIGIIEYIHIEKLLLKPLQVISSMKGPTMLWNVSILESTNYGQRAFGSFRLMFDSNMHLFFILFLNLHTKI